MRDLFEIFPRCVTGNCVIVKKPALSFMMAHKPCLVIVIVTLFFSTPSSHDVSAVCISGSTIEPIINGRYEYYSYNDDCNGPIYYNSQTNGYLFPHIYRTGEKFYKIGPTLNDPFTATHFCCIPSSSTSPYDCLANNGGQFCVLSQNKWEGTLFECDSSESIQLDSTANITTNKTTNTTTNTPTNTPTSEPTLTPTSTPIIPTFNPTFNPTDIPSVEPTIHPTEHQTDSPSSFPSHVPIGSVTASYICVSSAVRNMYNYVLTHPVQNVGYLCLHTKKY